MVIPLLTRSKATLKARKLMANMAVHMDGLVARMSHSYNPPVTSTLNIYNPEI